MWTETLRASAYRVLLIVGMDLKAFPSLHKRNSPAARTLGDMDRGTQ